MYIEIKHKESETKMYIYGFDIFDDFTYEHVSTMISCRNDENDIWGHLWNEKYKKDLEEEYEKIVEAHPNLDSVEIEDLLEFYALEKKYNPCCNKTVNGETYYSGCSFSNRGAESDEYKLKISDETIYKNILIQFTKKLKKLRYVNRRDSK